MNQEQTIKEIYDDLQKVHEVQVRELALREVDSERLSNLYVKIVGNGDPTKGISYKVFRIEELMEEQQRRTEQIKDSSTSAMFTFIYGMFGGLIIYVVNEIGLF